jgi:hypothetical protein
VPSRDKVTFQVDAASSERSARGRDWRRCGWNGAPSSDADQTRRDEPGTISSLGGSLPSRSHVRTHPSTVADCTDPRADNWKQRVARCSPLATRWWWARTWTPMLFGCDQERRRS